MAMGKIRYDVPLDHYLFLVKVKYEFVNRFGSNKWYFLCLTVRLGFLFGWTGS